MKKIFAGIIMFSMVLTGSVFMTGCTEEKKSADPASMLAPAALMLMMSQGQTRQTYFPEIPKGVAQ